METKDLLIYGFGILVVMLLLVHIYRKRHQTWTKEQRATITDLLTRKPLLNCPKNYASILTCVVDRLEKMYNYPRALTIVNGGLRNEDINVLMECVTPECFSEVLMNEHAGMPQKCADCIVKKALDEVKQNKVMAGAALHNPDKLSVYMKACLVEGACSAPPPAKPDAPVAPVAPSDVKKMQSTMYSLAGCC